MKLRFIKPKQPKRILIRCPFTQDTFKLCEMIFESGYQPVGFVKYWIHVLFWNKRSK